MIRKLIADFPALPIRLIVTPEKIGSNDKVNKLCGLARAARHNLLVLSDADIRVGPDHLRSVAAPFRDAQVGAVTSLFTGIPLHSLWPELEAIYLSTDFMPSVLMARQMEGVRFAMGATIGIRRECLAEIGGFEALADELRTITNSAAAPPRVDTEWNWSMLRLRPGAASRACGSSSFNACAGPSWPAKPGPLGYVGLIFTQGLPWTVLAVILAPTRLLALSFVAAYLILRMGVVWTMGIWGLRDDLLKRRWWLVPLWDAFAFILWCNSLFWSRVRWRGVEYRVSEGRLIPVAPQTKR